MLEIGNIRFRIFEACMLDVTRTDYLVHICPSAQPFYNPPHPSHLLSSASMGRFYCGLLTFSSRSMRTTPSTSSRASLFLSRKTKTLLLTHSKHETDMHCINRPGITASLETTSQAYYEYFHNIITMLLNLQYSLTSQVFLTYFTIFLVECDAVSLGTDTKLATNFLIFLKNDHSFRRISIRRIFGFLP